MHWLTIVGLLIVYGAMCAGATLFSASAGRKIRMVHHRCGCGKTYTYGEWRALPEVGTYTVLGVGRINSRRLYDAKRCGCGSVSFAEVLQ